MPVGVYRLGGGVCCMSCRNKSCLLPMTYTVWKTNDFYYKPGNSASWVRKSKPSGKGNGKKIGINRLGGVTRN